MYNECAHGLHPLLVSVHDDDRVELDGSYRNLLEIEIQDDENSCYCRLMIIHRFESTRGRFLLGCGVFSSAIVVSSGV